MPNFSSPKVPAWNYLPSSAKSQLLVLKVLIWAGLGQTSQRIAQKINHSNVYAWKALKCLFDYVPADGGRFSCLTYVEVKRDRGFAKVQKTYYLAPDAPDFPELFNLVTVELTWVAGKKWQKRESQYKSLSWV